MMKFIENNLAILVPAIVTIASGILSTYLYLENKKIKKYATERDMKRRKASLEKLRNEHRSNNWMLATLGEKEKEQNEFICREKELLAEIEYLEKVLKIRE